MFYAVYCDEKGNAYADDRHLAIGRIGAYFSELEADEWLPLPPGASLVMLPGRAAAGLDEAGRFTHLGSRKLALGALLPQGYTRLALPAFTAGEQALPLYGYTAVAWRDGGFFVAAKQEDESLHKWDPSNYNLPELARRIEERQREFPENPIIGQLAKCSLEYGCFTAQNIFYRRWEGGLPVSGACNAACVGCISEQEAECCPSPQSRIAYLPQVEQVVEIAVAHLQAGQGSIASFGQGCEGEPLLQAPLIAESIRRVRRVTAAGTINANTNAGDTHGVRLVCEAGIDSLRVSLNSAVPENYHAYYRPRGYSFSDVIASLRLAKQSGVYVALNLLAFPGVTDREDELEALVELIKTTEVDMVQVRNLNIDPEAYLRLMQHSQGEMYGLKQLADILTAEVPGIVVGSFSRPVR